MSESIRGWIVAALAVCCLVSPVAAQTQPAEEPAAPAATLPADAEQGVAASAPADEPSAPARMRVAVADFSITGDVGIAEAGKAVTELLIAELGNGAFQVVERSQLTSVLEEHQLSMSQVVSNPALLAKHLKGVSHLVTGSVVRLGSLSISARLVDVHTGDIVRTAKVSALDARALEAALGELARQLQGEFAAVQAAKSHRPITLELNALVYGRMVWNGQSLRCGPRETAVFKDFPPLETLKFYPDPRYQADDRVRTTGVLGGGTIQVPAGSLGTVLEDMNTADDNGQEYRVRLDEGGPVVRISARFIEPLQAVCEPKTVALTPWYYDRPVLRGTFVWGASHTGRGIRLADAGLSPEQIKDAAFLTAALDAVRQIGEMGRSTSPQPDVIRVAACCDFNGIMIDSETIVRDFVVESDLLHVSMADRQGRPLKLAMDSYVLKDAAQFAGKGYTAILREMFDVLCPGWTEAPINEDGVLEVTLNYTGIVAHIDGDR